MKRGEICRIPGCSVSPSAPGTPTPVRLPQFQGETFKQFINYVYTGKVRTVYKWLCININNICKACDVFIVTRENMSAKEDVFNFSNKFLTKTLFRQYKNFTLISQVKCFHSECRTARKSDYPSTQ